MFYPNIHMFLSQNKKVLLRERKRHTAHHVVSTLSVVLTGYPPPILTWPGGVPYLGTPPGRVPLPRPDLAGYLPPPRLNLAGYPPRCLPHGILGNVAKHYGIWVPPQLDLARYPPPPPRSPVSTPWHSG